MVHLDFDTCEAPVILRFTTPFMPTDEADYLRALDQIATLDRPFTLMTVFEGHIGLSREAERDQALWFKRTRERMNGCCKALAIVRGDAHAEMADVFRKLWTFPIIATADEQAAMLFLNDHQKASA